MKRVSLQETYTNKSTEYELTYGAIIGQFTLRLSINSFTDLCKCIGILFPSCRKFWHFIIESIYLEIESGVLTSFSHEI